MRCISRLLWLNHLRFWQFQQKEQAQTRMHSCSTMQSESLSEDKDEVLNLNANDRNVYVDALKTYFQIVDYCSTELDLNVSSKSNWACLFRTSAVKLPLTRHETTLETHEETRQECVELVFERYSRAIPIVQQSVGYERWDDWRV